MIDALIYTLAQTSSRRSKEKFLKEGIEQYPDFARGFRRALDTYETFGIKQVPVGSKGNFKSNTGFDATFHATLDLLASRELSGNDAIDAVKYLESNTDPNMWKYFYSRILLKDMKCGISIATWNKVAPKEFKVPVFSCQLAKDGADIEHTGKKLIEVKLDGVRVITIVNPNGKVEMFSRNGKPLTNFPKISQWFTDKVAPQLEVPMVFDGEVMSSSFQDLMKQVHRKDNVQTDDACLYLFDNVTLEEFKAGVSKVPQNIRSKELLNIADYFHTDIIRVVEQEEVDFDTDAGKQAFKDINQKAIDGGYEGIMIKDPDAPYETKRTKSWLKIKPVIEVTLEVKSVEIGTGKNSERLGNLICEGNDMGHDIRVSVGSGFSETLREEIWDDKESVIGQLIEVKADAITQNQDGTYSLRFPRFKCFRGFNPGEKL